MLIALPNTLACCVQVCEGADAAGQGFPTGHEVCQQRSREACDHGGEPEADPGQRGQHPDPQLWAAGGVRREDEILVSGEGESYCSMDNFQCGIIFSFVCP